MKILEVHNWFRFMGGEDTLFELTCEILLRGGYEISTFERNSMNIKGMGRKIIASVEGIYSISAKRAFLSFLNSQKPNIVDVHNLYPLISPSILSVCKKISLPVVLRCQDYRLICPTGFHLQKGTVCKRCNGDNKYWCILKNCRNNIFESLAYALRSIIAQRFGLFKNNVTCYIPPTIFVKEQLVSAGFPEGRIFVVPNVVQVADQVDNIIDNKYIGYVGRISPEKGIMTLLASAKETNLPIIVAGDYTSMPGIQNSGLNNVRFLGYLDKNQLSKFYQSIRFLVVPSITYETFGIAAAEAMSHGLPIIASRIGGLPEVVEDGVNGLLFEPGNAEDLSRKILLLWENPDLCRQMGLAGHKMAQREFNEGTYQKRLSSVFRKAIEING